MILNKVAAYITDKQLLAEREKVIIGLSGGADSIALVDILSRLGYKCVVAHCNFHLRGDESDRDAAFVDLFCRSRNINLHTVDFDTVTYAKAHKLSIEMAARELRYNWFDKICSELEINALAVAHHQDDSVETVLLNLIRGTGIRGLTGIMPRNGRVIRPLLCLSRKEILDYIDEKGLTYVTDSTNNETDYTRNKIRLDIIPLLEAINPSAKDAIACTSEYLSQVERIYSEYLSDCKTCVMDGNKIKINELVHVAEPQAVLYELLTPFGFNSSSTEQIFNSLNGLSGKRFYSDTHQLIKDRDNLIISHIKDEDEEDTYYINEDDQYIDTPLKLKIETIENTPDINIEKNKSVVYLNKDKLQYPLTLRRWKQGDWFVPFGMKGRKKLSDYFSDNKFSLLDKENVWILVSGNDIIWIVGHRSDERIKIVPSAKSILKINID